MKFTREQLIKELEYFYDLNELFNDNIENMSDKDIESKFNEHANNNLKEIEAGDLIQNHLSSEVLIDTPDGLQELGDFYIKKPRVIYEVGTVDGYKAKVSEDHLYETTSGWKKAKDLQKFNDYLITKSGAKVCNKIVIYDKEEVYDWEVLHENHRYWAGNGISSHNTGKTFLALNACREAQKMGYYIIYCDSETAVDQDTFEKFGLDPERVRYQPVTTIQEFTTFVNNTLKTLDEAKKEKTEVPKIMMVLDSIGNLASEKEKADALSGSTARDMTKQQVIRSMFRTTTVDLAAHKIPFIIVNHVYQGIGLFASKEISGGGGVIYNPSIIAMLTKAKLKDGETGKDAKMAKDADMGQTGVVVSAWPKKNRFARPIPVKFHISFFRGMNKYTGLEKYISWKNCGIERGKLVSEKEWNKWVASVESNGNPDLLDFSTYKWISKDENGKDKEFFFLPKATSRSFVVKHLNTEVKLNEVFSQRVLTESLLRDLDENIIKPTFMLPDINDLEALAEIETGDYEKSDDILFDNED